MISVLQFSKPQKLHTLLQKDRLLWKNPGKVLSMAYVSILKIVARNTKKSFFQRELAEKCLILGF